MSIEQQLAELTSAVKANTEALLALGKAAPAAATSAPAAEEKAPAAEKPATKGRASKAKEEPAKEEPKSKYTREQMQAALNDLRENDGNPARAKKIIADAGFEKMKDISDDKIDEVYLAVKALFEADKAEIEKEDDDI